MDALGKVGSVTFVKVIVTVTVTFWEKGNRYVTNYFLGKVIVTITITFKSNLSYFSLLSQVLRKNYALHQFHFF